ncbi:MAG TPA: glycosyltransferase, partial [Bryobacteraceae bacterium]|nr:glycosyltransferase [Bryobacteraceae bacterium]
MDNWSYTNLVANHGVGAGEEYRSIYPDLIAQLYSAENLNVDEAIGNADLVLVHEWNEPGLVSRIGKHHLANGNYTLLFHDTHHRSVTEPESMARYDLEHYDGVLAFGESVAEVYRQSGWSKRVWTWHEAADTRVFRPIQSSEKQGDLVWVGNWGDDERTAELREFLIEPVRQLGLRARIHGVRYPPEALETLAAAGIHYADWIPNFKVPEIFSRHHFTVHVPRGPYARALPGIPTIRVFEALACGIPLISAPWQDSESLFEPGRDFLTARNGEEMKSQMSILLH